jgi:hypothetical protein
MPVADVDKLAGTLRRPGEWRTPILGSTLRAFEHRRQVELAVEVRIRTAASRPSVYGASDCGTAIARRDLDDAHGTFGDIVGDVVDDGEVKKK